MVGRTTAPGLFITVDGMPNRTGRARHLSLVPDISTERDVFTSPIDDVDEVVGAGLSGIVQLTLDVRLAYEGPTVRRRIRVRSDLLLPEFHDVLQAAMGWGGRGNYVMSNDDASPAHTYCSPSVLASGQVGELDDHVRIDALLSSPDDTMQYRYGQWIHTVRVSSVDTDVDDLRPTCLDGLGVCPPTEGADELAAHPPRYDESPSITIEAANQRLRAAWRSRSPETESAAASVLVARLLRRARGNALSALVELLPRCELTIESSVDLPVAKAAMHKLSWFLQVVDRGVRLTDDGHLPATVVESMRDELDWGIGWVGPSTKESDHHQATDLRDAAKSLGLVRVFKGSLVRTKAGTSLLDDPIGLWRHCAQRIPLGRQDYEQDAGTLYLVALAASASAVQRDDMVVQSMNALGWGGGGNDAFEAQKAAHSTVAFLDLIGAHGPLFYLGSAASDSPSWARRFARDALRTRRPA